MYSKQQASLLKQSFWTAFGKYMAPVPSADGNKINWINYKTGVKHIFFRMQATEINAGISIVLANPDTAIQQADYNKLLSLRVLLEEELQEKWQWQQEIKDEYGKIYSVASKNIVDVNVLDESTWPAIISFLKPGIIALDNFWYHAKAYFE
ncbi:MAG: DUF4268 domain-containing protein [Bacteroidota bacterium]